MKKLRRNHGAAFKASSGGNIIKYAVIVLILCIVLSTSGCVLTKIVTVPMRLGAAVVSVVPVAGNTAHDAIDEAAETIDQVPL